mmetsp:Transcript_341/g.1317  ORF Transcript_341/g.1317 Transcript_341/m.1317 type:complete len:263 (-) Transcript_341:225-1013(-)
MFGWWVPALAYTPDFRPHPCSKDDVSPGSDGQDGGRGAAGVETVAKVGAEPLSPRHGNPGARTLDHPDLAAVHPSVGSLESPRRVDGRDPGAPDAGLVEAVVDADGFEMWTGELREHAALVGVGHVDGAERSRLDFETHVRTAEYCKFAQSRQVPDGAADVAVVVGAGLDHVRESTRISRKRRRRNVDAEVGQAREDGEVRDRESREFHPVAAQRDARERRTVCPPREMLERRSSSRVGRREGCGHRTVQEARPRGGVVVVS